MLILISRMLFMAAVWRVAEGKTPPPYRSDGSCENSFSEYHVKSLGLCCSKCKPGTRLKDECTSDLDTICEACPDGRFSDKMNHFHNCFSCQKCRDVNGLIYAKNCSADTQAVCVCAEPGMFCSKRNFNQECEECRKYTYCKPGQSVSKNGTHTSDFKCTPCPPGKFSDRSNAMQCTPHTQCEDRSVLRLGTSTTDTLCEKTPSPPPPPPPSITTPTRFLSHPPRNSWGEVETNMTTTTSLPTSSSVTASPSTGSNLIICIVMIACALVLLTLSAMVIIAYKLRKPKEGLRKVPITDVNKEQNASAKGTPSLYHRLLPSDRCSKEPSMTSSDSQSQPDSSHSSADWLERTSQEESILEQPSVSSPLVNVSITATFNCQLNPTAASCSIPLNTSALTPHVEAPVPLSQEEVCISCQQEDGKEALQSVQESGHV